MFQAQKSHWSKTPPKVFCSYALFSLIYPTTKYYTVQLLRPLYNISHSAYNTPCMHFKILWGLKCKVMHIFLVEMEWRSAPCVKKIEIAERWTLLVSELWPRISYASISLYYITGTFTTSAAITVGHEGGLRTPTQMSVRVCNFAARVKTLIKGVGLLLETQEYSLTTGFQSLLCKGRQLFTKELLKLNPRLIISKAIEFKRLMWVWQNLC